MSSHLSNLELLSALLDGQLQGEEKDRAQALASSAEYRDEWESLQQQRSLFQSLPEFRLPPDFVEQTLERAEAALNHGSDDLIHDQTQRTHANKFVSFYGQERPVAIGLFATLAALILAMIYLGGQTPKKGAGSSLAATGDSIQTEAQDLDDSKNDRMELTDDASEIKKPSVGPAENAEKVLAQKSTGEFAAARLQVKAAGADRLGGSRLGSSRTADEIWLVDLSPEASTKVIEKAFMTEGLELELRSARFAYQAVYLSASPLSVHRIFKRLADEDLSTSAVRLPAVPRWKESGEKQIQVLEQLEFFSNQAKDDPANHRSQLEQINRWFELNAGLADESSTLKKRNYLIMLRLTN